MSRSVMLRRERGCEADTLGLGWLPGETYWESFARQGTEVLGFSSAGAVIVRDVKTGVERQHMTARDHRHILCLNVPNIFGWRRPKNAALIGRTDVPS